MRTAARSSAPDEKIQAPGLVLTVERRLRRRGFEHVAGVDEVGRGPLAGPVAAAAVIFGRKAVPDGLADSKQLTMEDRERLYGDIARHALAIGVGFASPREIDAVNIRQATFLAMRRALAALPIVPHYALIDGRDMPVGWAGQGEAMIKGDASCASIAAASIVAKVTRDRLMIRLHRRDARYGFDQHKGYATALHRDALGRHGPSPHHRLSFAPCGPDGDAADENV